MAGAVAVAAMALFLCCAMASAQTDCSEQFTAMQPCLDFVGSNTLTAPSKQCCAAFKATQTTSPVCLCQLQQAFADPATAPGNATRANDIPALCAVAVDPSRCPGLLGLAPTVAPVAAPVVAPVVAPTVAAGPKGADVDCSAEFNSLATCIEFITSNDSVPPADCCTSLLNVHVEHPVCLCQLLQQVNGDPSAASGLNVTKALELPTVCNVHTDVNRCPALLGQPVASPLGEPVAPEAPGPDSAPAPEAGAPGISDVTPVAPEASPVVTAPSGSGAHSIIGATSTPLAMLLGFLLSSSLHFALHFLF